MSNFQTNCRTYQTTAQIGLDCYYSLQISKPLNTPGNYHEQMRFDEIWDEDCEVWWLIFVSGIYVIIGSVRYQAFTRTNGTMIW